MKCLTWNIQWGQGEDGRVDLDRIANVIRAQQPDLVCLQEVCRNFRDNTGHIEPDQVAGLCRRLPEYVAEFAPATDLRLQGERCQFGNLTLSRLPVIAVACHRLPRPAVDGPESARSALELLVEGPWGPLRVINTHLEYYSLSQRLQQASYLLERHREACDWARRPVTNANHSLTPMRTLPRTTSTLLCGDFNAPPDDAALRILTTDSTDLDAPLLDVWRHRHPDQPHPPTLGLHSPGRDPRDAICVDYMLLTPDLTRRVRVIESDPDCTASDHQPLWLILDAEMDLTPCAISSMPSRPRTSKNTS